MCSPLFLGLMYVKVYCKSSEISVCTTILKDCGVCIAKTIKVGECRASDDKKGFYEKYSCSDYPLSAGYSVITTYSTPNCSYSASSSMWSAPICERKSDKKFDKQECIARENGDVDWQLSTCSTDKCDTNCTSVIISSIKHGCAPLGSNSMKYTCSGVRSAMQNILLVAMVAFVALLAML